MRNFSFGDDELEEIKYKFGDETTNFCDIEEYSLKIAFDYISLSQSSLCFDNPSISDDDFRKLFHLKKEISSFPIGNFLDDIQLKRKYHFHEINLNTKKFLIEPLKNLLGISKWVATDMLPQLYQIALYTNHHTETAPRIVGFFGKLGVFHLLWFDYNHSIYPMNS